MAQLSIRNLDDNVKVLLQLRARENGRSMEDEIRHILGDAVATEKGGAGTLIASCFKDVDFDYELEPMPKSAIIPAEFDT